ncbi:hypothetical protein BC828DRAFT_388128 [Blastocladiella britannica]|nr:hypothetical protein BC828DRAFT_388128 [Blastocladiella britannica]
MGCGASKQMAGKHGQQALPAPPASTAGAEKQNVPVLSSPPPGKAHQQQQQQQQQQTAPNHPDHTPAKTAEVPPPHDQQHHGAAGVTTAAATTATSSTTATAAPPSLSGHSHAHPQSTLASRPESTHALSTHAVHGVSEHDMHKSSSAVHQQSTVGSAHNVHGTAETATHGASTHAMATTATSGGYAHGTATAAAANTETHEAHSKPHERPGHHSARAAGASKGVDPSTLPLPASRMTLNELAGESHQPHERHHHDGAAGEVEAAHHDDEEDAMPTRVPLKGSTSNAHVAHTVAADPHYVPLPASRMTLNEIGGTGARGSAHHLPQATHPSQVPLPASRMSLHDGGSGGAGSHGAVASRSIVQQQQRAASHSHLPTARSIDATSVPLPASRMTLNDPAPVSSVGPKKSMSMQHMAVRPPTAIVESETDGDADPHGVPLPASLAMLADTTSRSSVHSTGGASEPPLRAKSRSFHEIANAEGPVQVAQRGYLSKAGSRASLGHPDLAAVSEDEPGSSASSPNQDVSNPGVPEFSVSEAPIEQKIEYKPNIEREMAITAVIAAGRPLPPSMHDLASKDEETEQETSVVPVKTSSRRGSASVSAAASSSALVGGLARAASVHSANSKHGSRSATASASSIRRKEYAYGTATSASGAVPRSGSRESQKSAGKPATPPLKASASEIAIRAIGGSAGSSARAKVSRPASGAGA